MRLEKSFVFCWVMLSGGSRALGLKSMDCGLVAVFEPLAAIAAAGLRASREIRGADQDNLRKGVPRG